MATIRKQFEVDADVDSVWQKVADVGNISKLIGFVETSEKTPEGRVCKLDNGGTLKEKIISVETDLKRVVYSITESPLDMEFHIASMELAAIGSKTQFTWTVDLLPKEASGQLGALMDAGVEDMKKSLV